MTNWFSLSIFLIFVTITLGCSFKEFKQPPGADPAALKVASSFSSLNSVIFQAKCARCHSGANAPHGIDLSSYAAIMNSSVFPPLVVPNNPESSSLYTSVKSGSMPKNKPPLSAIELQAIYDWIKAGAKEKEDDPSDGGGNDDDDEPDDDDDDDEPKDCEEPEDGEPSDCEEDCDDSEPGNECEEKDSNEP